MIFSFLTPKPSKRKAIQIVKQIEGVKPKSKRSRRAKARRRRQA